MNQAMQAATASKISRMHTCVYNQIEEGNINNSYEFTRSLNGTQHHLNGVERMKMQQTRAMLRPFQLRLSGPFESSS